MRGFRRPRFIVALALALIATALAVPASAARWNFETLDGEGGANGRIPDRVGSHTSLTVWRNEPHVFYFDETNNDLRHAWWTGSAWFFETLDGSCPTTTCADGSVSTVIAFGVEANVWAGTPHVWYFDATSGHLRHAWWTGSRWQFEILDGAGGTNGRIESRVGAFPSVVVWNNQPHAFYRNITGRDLRHDWYG